MTSICRDSDVCVLTGIEEIQALVDDHILRAQTMHASSYIAPLEPLLQAWEEQLVGVQDIMDVWLKVQSTWLYLEPIFSSEDIQRQMASDAAKFTQVDWIFTPVRWIFSPAWRGIFCPDQRWLYNTSPGIPCSGGGTVAAAELPAAGLPRAAKAPLR